MSNAVFDTYQQILACYYGNMKTLNILYVISHVLPWRCLQLVTVNITVFCIKMYDMRRCGTGDKLRPFHCYALLLRNLMLKKGGDIMIDSWWSMFSCSLVLNAHPTRLWLCTTHWRLESLIRPPSSLCITIPPLLIPILMLSSVDYNTQRKFLALSWWY